MEGEGGGSSQTNGNAGEGGGGTPVLGLLLQGMGMGGQQDAYNSYMSPMGGMGMGPMGGMGMGMGGMGGMGGKNIVYHFPNKIYKNMLRVSLTKKMLTKRLTRVAIPNPDLDP